MYTCRSTSLFEDGLAVSFVQDIKDNQNSPFLQSTRKFEKIRDEQWDTTSLDTVYLHTEQLDIYL
jgi:hypothetical protein